MPYWNAIDTDGRHVDSEKWRKDAQSFAHMALVGGVGDGSSVNLTGAGEPERIPAARVSSSLFQMLGARAELGRMLIDDDDQLGRDQVVVISHNLWRRRFASDREIVGRSITLDGASYEVVGVLSAAFHFPKLGHLYAIDIAAERPDIWKPMALRPQELTKGNFDFVCIAQLEPETKPGMANSELNVLEKALMRQFQEPVDLRAVVLPLQAQIVGRSKIGLELMLAAVGIVLLIGCINITNLFLARMSVRARELGVRVAIGASRGRLLRQVLVESMALALVGGAMGIMIAYGLIQVILAVAPGDVPRLDEVRIDLSLVLFAATISPLTGVFVGVVPVWRFNMARVADVMAGGVRMTGRRGASRLRSALVSLEIALSAFCLIVGGLLLHSFVNLLNVDRGFKTERIVTVDLNLGTSRYPNMATRADFTRAALARLRALPGVESVGTSNMLPLGGEGNNSAMFVEGSSDAPAFERPLANVRSTNPDYFRTFGIALRRGRLFGDADGDHHVAMLSASMAARAWPGQDAVGRRFRFGRGTGPLIEVVGIVADVRGISLDRGPSTMVYVPYWQGPSQTASIAVKTATDPVAMSSSIRAVIRDLDAELPLSAFRTMDDVVANSVSRRRFQMNLVLLFAAAGMLLASIGIYGVMSYVVVQRTNEIGTRMALGANPQAVQRMVLADALRLVSGGLVVGVPLVLATAATFRSLLFGVAPYDWLSVIGACMVLTTAAITAAYIPARRASRVDPMVALRCE